MEEILAIMEEMGLLKNLKTDRITFCSEMFVKYDANDDGVLRCALRPPPPLTPTPAPFATTHARTATAATAAATLTAHPPPPPRHRHATNAQLRRVQRVLQRGHRRRARAQACAQAGEEGDEERPGSWSENCISRRCRCRCRCRCIGPQMASPSRLPVTGL